LQEVGDEDEGVDIRATDIFVTNAIKGGKGFPWGQSRRRRRGRRRKLGKLMLANFS